MWAGEGRGATETEDLPGVEMGQEGEHGAGGGWLPGGGGDGVEGRVPGREGRKGVVGGWGEGMRSEVGGT